MSEIDFIPLNLSAGYGAKKLQLTKDGATQELNYQGATLAGDLALDFSVKEEGENVCLALLDKNDCEEVKEKSGFGREKGGIRIINAHADAMFGKANDNYMRFALDLGPYLHGDTEYFNSFRVVVGFGVTGRWETSRTSLPEGQNASGNNWNVNFPLAFGLGAKKIFVQDKLNLTIELSPSFKMRNEVCLSYRPYANYLNKYVQTIDISACNIFELGKISDSTKERNSFWLGGVNLGLFGFSTPTR